MNETEDILPHDGEAYYFPSVFDEVLSVKYYDALAATAAWRQEPIKIFGREVMQPRLTAWYGDPGKSYTYSGVTMHPHAWLPELLAIKRRCQEIAQVHFNSALLNWYRDGNDHMGWHRDNEKALGREPVIASVSLGSERVFEFRNYVDKKSTRAILLQAGSVLLMRGRTQQHWEHRLPKKPAFFHGRINITFRVV